MARVRSSRDLIADAKRRVRLVSAEDAKHHLDSAAAPVLIDVRDEFEHEVERIGASVHVSRGTLEMTIEHDYPDRDTHLLLYCASGDRSALAARTLMQMGYRRVASLDGGMHAWRERGFAVVVPGASGGGSGI